MKNSISHLISCFLLCFLLTQASFAQVFINELDSDSPGIDDKEFVEIRTLSPNTSLNGYVLVFFNGNPTSSTANQSYFAIDLNGLTTDVNGLVTIGNTLVSPVPNRIFPDNTIQNGEDAIAIYQTSISNFPTGTVANMTNLVDALAYDTSDPDAVALMALLGVTTQINENEQNAQTTESIQRKDDGTFEVKAPTPGAMNDGSGTAFNGITIAVSTADHSEGDTLQISFTTQTNVTSNLNFTIALNSGSFNSADFTGNLSINIPSGSNSAMTVITIVDDVLNEGDETMKIRFGTLPAGYSRLNDNVEVRIVDNDFSTDPWGTPLAPTYGVVTPTIPVGYYNSLNGLSGAALKQALQDIIANPQVVRAHNYGDIVDILKVSDRNPRNNNQVWLMYVEQPRAKLDFQSTGSNTGKWNREHIYPQSRGGFSNGTADIPDGINVYLPTDANDILAGHADAHALRAEDGPENTIRNNKDYGGTDYNGPTGTANSWRGDVSRAVFYMCVRYNGLNVVSGNPADATVGQLGDKDSMLIWNHSDLRDDFEMNRNNYIYTWQQNRNPFIDMPDLADYIFGANVGQVWFNPTAIADVATINWVVYPNPAQHQVSITGISGNATIEIYSCIGELILQQSFTGQVSIPLAVTPGIYTIKIDNHTKTIFRKLVVSY